MTRFDEPAHMQELRNIGGSLKRLNPVPTDSPFDDLLQRIGTAEARMQSRPARAGSAAAS